MLRLMLMADMIVMKIMMPMVNILPMMMTVVVMVMWVSVFAHGLFCC